MSNISRDINHAITYINKFKSLVIDISECSADAFSDLQAVDTSEEGYYSELVNINRKYDKEVAEILLGEEEEFETFKSAISNIVSNKDDDQIIYHISNFTSLEIELIKLRKKKIKDMQDNIEDELHYVMNKSNFRGALCYKNIIANLNKVYNMIEYTINQLNKITGLSKEEIDKAT